MMVLKKALILTAAASITGCTALNPASQQDIETLSDDQLCSFYRYKSFGVLVGRDELKKRNPEIRAEIDRRGLIADWAPVDAKQIRVGMSRCAALAAWGPPTKTNRASYGDQWVYCRDGAYCINSQYVYVRSGEVTGWN